MERNRDRKAERNASKRRMKEEDDKVLEELNREYRESRKDRMHRPIVGRAVYVPLIRPATIHPNWRQAGYVEEVIARAISSRKWEKESTSGRVSPMGGGAEEDE